MKSPNANRLETPHAHILESSNIDLLKLEVEKTLGRKIVFSADCLYLQSHISKLLQHTLSFNTLRRFFKLMEAKHQQSVYTLDVLSHYCGYSSFTEFVHHKKQNESGSKPEDSSLLDYLVRIFKGMELKNPNDPTYLSLVGQTIQYLEHQPHYFEDLHREIARTKNGQKIYFEKFINIDKLNSYYGDGLRYYLRENNTKEGQIFGHSFLCLRYWFTGNPMGVERHYKEVLQHTIDYTIPPHIAGCFFATQVLYADAFNKPQDAVLSGARLLFSAYQPSRENLPLIFQGIKHLAQALLLTGHYEEAAFYLEDAYSKRKNYIPAECDLEVWEAIDLFQAFVKMQMGEPAATKKILNSINPDNFYFLHKQYLTTLYLSLKQKLHKTAPMQEQIQDLIHKTGFHKLASC